MSKAQDGAAVRPTFEQVDEVPRFAFAYPNVDGPEGFTVGAFGWSRLVHICDLNAAFPRPLCGKRSRMPFDFVSASPSARPICRDCRVAFAGKAARS